MIEDLLTGAKKTIIPRVKKIISRNNVNHNDIFVDSEIRLVTLRHPQSIFIPRIIKLDTAKIKISKRKHAITAAIFG